LRALSYINSIFYLRTVRNLNYMKMWTWKRYQKIFDAKDSRKIILKILNELIFIQPIHIFCSGADLSALVRESSEFALKEFIRNPCADNEFVKRSHFEQAYLKIKPSVSPKVLFFNNFCIKPS
jgi:SpoVK/Ycf46/Vps4 family AAA+-type ATPase